MKKGISLVILIVVIIVLTILTGIVSISASAYIKTMEVNEFAVEILNIQNSVDEYFLQNNSYPAGEEIKFDLSTVLSKDKYQYQNETITDNIINLKAIKLELIGITRVEFGNNKQNNDIYVLSEETGIVYYLRGVQFDDKVYYTLNEDLYEKLEITPSVVQTPSKIIKNDVIFELNNGSYTSNPVVVNVKIPREATVESVTTTNSKSISAEKLQGMYKVITINSSSSDKTGNYSITVNYTYNGVVKQVEYDVTNFDNTPPTYTKTQNVNGEARNVQIEASDDMSGIKHLKYEIGTIKDVAYFKEYGKNIQNGKFTISDLETYTLYIEDNAGNKIIKPIYDVPVSWQDSIYTIVDGVPIPKGFVASPYDGEKLKEQGLVIYELTKQEIANGLKELPAEQQYKSWTERNQYVWIPVEDFNEFKREAFGLNYKMSFDVLGVDYWELEIVERTNTPKSVLNDQYMTQSTLEEALKMYASVKKYGGFYMGRYEAGVDVKRTMTDGNKFEDVIYTVMGKIPYTCVRFATEDTISYDQGGAVQEVRELYQEPEEIYKVTATIPYGVQWDSVLKWWIKTGAVSDVTVSESYGNMPNTVINANDFNTGARYAQFTTSMGTYVNVSSTTTKIARSIILFFNWGLEKN